MKFKLNNLPQLKNVENGAKIKLPVSTYPLIVIKRNYVFILKNWIKISWDFFCSKAFWTLEQKTVCIRICTHHNTQVIAIIQLRIFIIYYFLQFGKLQTNILMYFTKTRIMRALWTHKNALLWAQFFKFGKWDLHMVNFLRK